MARRPRNSQRLADRPAQNRPLVPAPERSFGSQDRTNPQPPLRPQQRRPALVENGNQLQRQPPPNVNGTGSPAATNYARGSQLYSLGTSNALDDHVQEHRYVNGDGQASTAPFANGPQLYHLEPGNMLNGEAQQPPCIDGANSAATAAPMDSADADTEMCTFPTAAEIGRMINEMETPEDGGLDPSTGGSVQPINEANECIQQQLDPGFDPLSLHVGQSNGAGVQYLDPRFGPVNDLPPQPHNQVDWTDHQQSDTGFSLASNAAPGPNGHMNNHDNWQISDSMPNSSSSHITQASSLGLQQSMEDLNGASNVSPPQFDQFSGFRQQGPDWGVTLAGTASLHRASQHSGVYQPQRHLEYEDDNIFSPTVNHTLPPTLGAANGTFLSPVGQSTAFTGDRGSLAKFPQQASPSRLTSNIHSWLLGNQQQKMLQQHHQFLQQRRQCMMPHHQQQQQQQYNAVGSTLADQQIQQDRLVPQDSPQSVDGLPPHSQQFAFKAPTTPKSMRKKLEGPPKDDKRRKPPNGGRRSPGPAA